jgi:DNA (cytosine-5)-methyltransferase 1
MDEPLTTFSARGQHHALICPPALLLPYYSRSGPRPVTQPMGTLTTRDRYALVQYPDVPAVEDCTLRMFAPREIAAGMAFASDYRVKGNKRQQVAGFGNAVTPPVPEVLVSALVEAITGEDLERAA